MPWRPRPRAAMALLLGAGALMAVLAGLRAPLPPPPPVSINDTLTLDASGCAKINARVWHPLSGVEYTGRLRVTLPPQIGGAVTMYVGDTLPVDLEADDEAGLPVVVQPERLLMGPGVQVPPDYWLDDGSPAEAPPHVTRLQVDAAGDHTRTVTLSLGRRAPRVLARLVNYPPTARVPVCAAPLDRGETYFGSGWLAQETGLDGTVHWMGATGAILIARAGHERVRIRARVAPARTPMTVTLGINEVFEAAPVALQEGFQMVEWIVPGRVWLPGTNELLFRVFPTDPRQARTRGLALASLDVD